MYLLSFSQNLINILEATIWCNSKLSAMSSVLVVGACLLITVSGGAHISNKHHNICSAYGYQLLEAKFGSEVHVLCLKLQPIGE